MTTTTYYNLNIVEGTDIVNPLIVDNPNYEKIDETMHNNAVSGVTLATEIANATVHAITRENSECAVIRFIATSNWKAGDTATVDGVPVTVLLPSGETLPDGAYVINANVLCILTGTNLTIYAERKAESANEIAYNDTTVAAELLRLDKKTSNLVTELQSGCILAKNVNTVTMNGFSTDIVTLKELTIPTDYRPNHIVIAPLLLAYHDKSYLGYIEINTNGSILAYFYTTYASNQSPAEAGTVNFCASWTV